jgi:hypothetical protein
MHWAWRIKQNSSILGILIIEILMKKYIIIIVSLFLLVINNQTINAQPLLKETVWLQTNRDIYLAGEELHYKVKLLENDTYQPSVLSKNVRIELTDVEGNKIVKKNSELENSQISDKISLPVNIRTGRYYLRAYSNWMRNFTEDEFSELEIRVLNNDDADQDSLLLRNSKVNVKIYPYSDPDDPQRLKCSVFSSNNYGEGIESEGFILSALGDTVLTFQSDKTGWTSSFYRASDISSYQAFVKGFQKDDINFELNMIHNRDKQVNSSVTKKDGYLNVKIIGANSGSDYKLLLHRKYSWSWFHTITADNNSLVFRIPLVDIPTGLSQIAVLDKENKIIFKQLWSDYNENVAKVTIEMDASNITTDSQHGFNYYSKAIFDENSTGGLHLIADRFLPETRMYNYLPGLPGWTANYKIPARKNGFEGWINANLYSDEITNYFFVSNNKSPKPPDLRDTLSIFDHYPETRGGILSGKLFNKETGKAASLANIALTVLNDNRFYSTKTDENGKFVFTFPDQNFSRDYILNYVDRYDTLWQLDIIPDYEPSKPKEKSFKAFFTPEELKFLKSQKLNIKLRNLYSIEAENKLLSGTDTFKMEELFYGKPEITIEVQDYVRLSDVREVIFEVVPSVIVRKQNNKYILNVTGDYLHSSTYPTLVLFDGIPIYDYDELLNLPPERIKSIEAKNNFYIHGNAIFEGVISIRSVNNDFGGLNFPETAILSTLHLPGKAVNESVRTPRSKSEGIPNLDDILVWENLKGISTGKSSIYFNNNPEKYILSVYGYDRDGKWNTGRLILNVR